MRIAMFATSVCLTLLGTIAPAQSVTYDHDRSARFSTYRTYAWTHGTELTDELDHRRVVRAIDAALAAKGLEWVGSGGSPRVLVAYHASFDENFEISGAVRGSAPIGVSDDDGNKSATVQPVPVGTLVVDITEAWTGAIVWRSRASSDIKPTDKPESRDKKIAKVVEMFDNYPALHNGASWLRLRGLVFKSVPLRP